jgi:hypothetical protein
MRYIFALLFAVSLALGQQLDLKSQSRNADFSTHAFIKPWVIGTSLPATCSVGDAFFDSDATAGQNVYVCTATNTWTLSSGAISGLTASRALQSDGSGNVAVSSVTSTELGYLSGVTSGIQGQIDGKAAASHTHAAGDITSGQLAIAQGGTGQTTAQGAIDALVPSQSGKTRYVLGTDGTNSAWVLPIPSHTIASPPASPYTGLVVVFTDAANASDCTTGGGSAAALCRYNGSAYVALGGSGGGGGLGDPGANGVVVRTALNTTTARTLTAGTGVVVTNGSGVGGNPTFAADTAVMLGRAQAQAGSDLRCVPASASGANYTCAMSPTLTAYTDGAVIEFEPDVSSSAGAITLNVDALGSRNVKQSDGTTDPGASALVAGRQVPLRYDGSVWRMGVVGSGGGGMGDPGANGMMARTALNTSTARTLTGTSNEIGVTNGDGVSGNPTFALSSTLDLSGKTSTKPSKTGTTPPATCAVGETFIDTDATASSQWLVCTATNTWTAQGDSGGGMSTDWMDQTKVFLRDDFFGGGTGANPGFWSELQWRSTGSATGTYGVVASESNHPGIFRITTTATSGNWQFLGLEGNGGTSGGFTYTDAANGAQDHLFVVRPVDAGGKYAIGFLKGDFDSDEGIYLAYDSAIDTNWMFCTSYGSTPTRTDSGVAFVANAWVKVRIISDTSGYVKIRVNSTTSSNINSTLPDTAISPGIYVKTNSAAARSIDIDFYAGMSTLTR